LLAVVFLLVGASVANAAVEVTILGPTSFTRHKGKPVVAAVTFPGPIRAATVRLANNRVSSATVTLNGRPVFRPSDFNRNVEQLEARGILLEEQNELEVCLKGKPGGQITIQIAVSVDAEGANFIGPAGGTVEVTDPESPIYRAGAVIPEGALPEGGLVILDWVEDPPAMPDWHEPIGDFILYSGEGFATLAKPVNLFVPYPDEDDDGLVDGTSVSELTGLGCLYYDEATEDWEAFSDFRVDETANLLEIAAGTLSVVTPVAFDNPGASLRLMTYNAAFNVTGMPDVNIIHPVTKQVLEYTDDDDVKERARLIAEGIHRVDPDILVLNEIWDDAAEEHLRDHLRSTYPNYVQYLDGETFGVQDSGLMLFSKSQYPFLPLSFPPPSEFDLEDGDCIAHHASQGDWCDHVAFADFGENCESYDCLANKGAGLVRMENLSTHEAFTLVFAHLQASYGGEDDKEDRQDQVEYRHNQLRLIEEMILSCLTLTESRGNPIFMLGDLNINGHTMSDWPGWPNWHEWDNYFDAVHYLDPTQGFYACGLNSPCPDANALSMFVDTWGYETSPDDFGRTTGCNFLFSPDDPTCGDRLDYILHSRPRDSLCAQHIAKAWDLHYEGTPEHPYSDHVPLIADFNLCSPYCKANIAREVPPLNPGGTDSFSDGEIRFPGSMQWHIIRVPGCYAIVNSLPDHVGFEVYESTDLSRPVKPYGGQPHPKFGPKYRMPDPPYYIRTFAREWTGDRWAPDRKWFGHYNIKIHRLNCTDRLESCPLDPVVRDDNNLFQWPASPVNADDTVWYSFLTDQGERGDFPVLTFYLVLPDGTVVPDYHSSNYGLEVEATDGVVVHFADKGIAEGGRQLFVKADKLEGEGGHEKEYFLKINRKLPMGQETTEIFYHTTLSYFYPQLVVCDVQDDIAGDDDIYYYMEVDSEEGWYDSRYEDVHDDPQWSYLAEFDTDSIYGGVVFDWGDPLRPGHPRKFTKWVVINLVEYDSTDENDRLYPFGRYLYEPAPNWRIYPLAEDQESFVGPLLWWAPYNYYDEPHYWLHGAITHKPPGKD
jgi:hypothetical protein